MRNIQRKETAMKGKTKSFAFSMLLTFSIIISAFANVPTAKAAKKVYYVPGSSYAYHSSKNCRSLSRTSKKKIKAISKKKAKAKKLKKCKIRGCW